jgi:hypothetical protein
MMNVVAIYPAVLMAGYQPVGYILASDIIYPMNIRISKPE